MSIFDKIKNKDEDKKPSLFSKLTEEKKGNQSSVFDKLKQPEIIIQPKDENTGSISGKVLAKNNVAIPYYLSQTAIYAPRSSSGREDRNISIPIWSQGKTSVSYQGPELDTKIDYLFFLQLILKKD